MDVVYTVKPSEVNEPLRYSLRSLENIPHGRVFIAGHKPRWVKNVIHIPNPQHKTKYTNSGTNIHKACLDGRVSDDFILMNDDFFIMRRIKKVPVFYKGTMAEMIKTYQDINSRAYLDGMLRTRDILATLGINDPLCYEMHTPMVMNKDNRLLISRLQKAINTKHEPVHIRTLYGNFFKLGGNKARDVKIYREEQELPRKPTFISTSQQTFAYGAVGEAIRDIFDVKSEYEI